MANQSENRRVLFLDSGIGGIPYFRHFRQRNPGQSVDYLADRQNFPYGTRGREELCAILAEIVNNVKLELDPGIIVLACNSASIAALPSLRESFPDLQFVGTVPAVKPAALASKTGKIGVLGTELTVRESYIRELGSKNGGCEIVGIAAPELVKFIESGLDLATEEKKTQTVRNYLDRLRETGADALVLGCTHFLFLLEDFRREASPDIAVFESVQGISQRVETLLALEGRRTEGEAAGGQNRLLLTGCEEPEASWQLWAKRLDCKLGLLKGPQGEA